MTGNDNAPEVPTPELDVSAFDNAPVKEAAYKRIQQEINALGTSPLAAILVWKRQHNALSIISRLPPEVLSKVFQFVELYSRMGCYVWKVSWVCVSHVCSQWRNVALACASLWSNVNLRWTNPPWVFELLARSKGSPLTVVAQGVNLTEATFRSALTHVSRVEKLSLSCYHTTMLKTLGELDKPAPMLVSLDLIFEGTGEGNKIPKRIFGGEIPLLREVNLRNCAVDWDGPLFRELTSLQIRNIPRNSRPSLAEVVATLAELPGLEILSLSAVLPSIPITGVIASHTLATRLPRLKHLRIESNVVGATFLLNHLYFPASTTITFRCHTPSRKYPLPDPKVALARIRELGQSLNKGQAIRCLVVGQTDNGSIEFQAWDTPGTYTEKPRGAPLINFLVSLMRNLPSPRQHSVEALRTIWTELPLQNLESFHVDYDGRPIPEAAWLSGLDQLTSLKNINAAEFGRSLLRALSIGSQPPSGTDGVRFIGLRNMTIEGWTFSGDKNARETSFEQLRSCLEGRHASRAGLDQLQVRNCSNIDSDRIDQLRQFVGTVIWDGHDDALSDSENENGDENDSDENKDDGDSGEGDERNGDDGDGDDDDEAFEEVSEPESDDGGYPYSNDDDD